ncbi:MAG: hypothetical protein L0Y72_06790 [Gemmataceae bacterium]|nr:hypothetical protein [Gemmataceae bacterium]MCI0738731.1 hypothetical protein [Gemmataceae bacterium]
MNLFRTSIVILFAAALVLAFAAPIYAADQDGKVKSIQADKKTFTLTDKDGRDHNFAVAATAKILINDKESKLADLKVGDMLTATWEQRGDQREVSKIVCKRTK